VECTGTGEGSKQGVRGGIVDEAVQNCNARRENREHLIEGERTRSPQPQPWSHCGSDDKRRDRLQGQQSGATIMLVPMETHVESALSSTANIPCIRMDAVANQEKRRGRAGSGTGRPGAQRAKGRIEHKRHDRCMWCGVLCMHAWGVCAHAWAVLLHRSAEKDKGKGRKGREGRRGNTRTHAHTDEREGERESHWQPVAALRLCAPFDPPPPQWRAHYCLFVLLSEADDTR
jgi:hypothetical protein